MGIQGLLPLLKSIHKPTHLRKFAGQVIGIDAYGWLHRGTVSCAIELAQQKPTRKHIDYALNRVRMLIHFGVKPYLVFDGDYLPSKAHTEEERARRRKESKKLGLELLAMGRSAQAHLELQKAVDVTPSMARELIEELKRMDVPYIVAPYEADAQLAYLEKQGVITGVLSEDSDLLVFGVNCLLTKLDQYGECVMINRSHFTACREVSLVGWSDKEFRMMAMLSGCDYLPSIGGMGLKTAYRIVRKHKLIERVVRTIQFDGKMKVPAGYLEDFTKAERTFLYQWAFCPQAKRLVNLNAIPADLSAAEMPFIGAYVEPELAAGVAYGDLDPNTKEPLTFNAAPRPSSLREAMVGTPNGKQGKPISEFFKPKRTPLAELDPNSFTPSPTQQRLLENQQRVSWSASHIPMAPPPLARRPPIDIPLSAPQPSRRAVGDQLATPSTLKSKRPRLCSDTAMAAHMSGSVGLEAARSRFFDKSTVQPSPSVRKATSQRRNNDFELHSDDSTAAAVAEIAATQEEVKVAETPSSKKRKEIEVFVDPGDDLSAHDPTISTESHAQTDMNEAAASARDNPLATPFSKGLSADFANLKNRYSLGAISPQSRLPRTHSAPQYRAPIFELPQDYDNVQHASRRPEHSRRESFSEVQVPKSSPPTMTAVHGMSGNVQADDHDDDNPISDEDWLAFEHQPIGNQLHTYSVQGSEDLLVPNSPEGNQESRGRGLKLDLARFAFAG